GEEALHVGVAGEAGGDLAHGVGVGAVERAAVLDGLGHVAGAEGLDERPVDGRLRGGARAGAFEGRPGRRHVLRVHRGVDVGAGLTAARGAGAGRAGSRAAQAGGTSSGFIGALTWGPRTRASPQAHIAQAGSRRCASRKARAASAWLKAKARTRPWSKNRCAIASSVATGRVWSPRPSRSGARRSPPCAKALAQVRMARSARRRAQREGIDRKVRMAATAFLQPKDL